MPTKFEEFIDTTNLKYYAVRLKDTRYLCFAYDKEKIDLSIKNSGLILSQIKNVYFSQLELLDLFDTNPLSCLKIDTISLGCVDDKLIQIPHSLAQSDTPLVNIDDISLSNHTISLNYDSKFIEGKTAYILSIIVVLFSLIVFSKVINSNMMLKDIDPRIEQLKILSKMPSTAIQTKSIIQKLTKISDKQINIRILTKYIFDIKKRLKGTLVEYSLKNNKVVLKVKNIKAKKLTKYLEKRYSLDSAVVKDGIVTIGFKI